MSIKLFKELRQIEIAIRGKINLSLLRNRRTGATNLITLEKHHIFAF